MAGLKFCGEDWFKQHGHNDQEIKRITSGVQSVDKIIEKDHENNWVLAKITQTDGNHALGIRWFWNKSGFPNRSGWGVWLVINKSMAKVFCNNSHIKEFAES